MQKNLLAVIAALVWATGTFAQTPGSSEKDDKTGMADSANAPISMTDSTIRGTVQTPVEASKKRVPQLLLDFADDQKDLWSSPKNLRFEDTTWLVPVSGFSAGLFVTDSSVSRHLSHDPKTISHYNNLSNAGVAALVGAGGGMWVLSHFNHNDHWRETGYLAGQAAIHSLVITESLKYSLRRERPYQGDGTGPFFQRGGTSFPSEHSAAAWSIAGVIAHEYPGPLTKLLAYSAASMVSYSRIRAEKHFPSDVLIGALLGQLAAHQVYKKHHDVEVGGDTWRSPAHLFYEDGHAKHGFIGSPSVPLDSWIYTALDRLAGMGLIDSAFAGMRPWTRLTCAQMVAEAQDRVDDAGPIAHDLIGELEREFQPELGGGAERGETNVRLESLYFRGENISGTPLTDGYHFAQTHITEFGRPYSQGWNSVTGFSAYSSSGPWIAYVRGELQTSPSVPELPLAARQTILNVDFFPSGFLPPATGRPHISQFELLDAYVGITFSNWQATFGRQSLWWGPGDGGPMMFSNNAQPIDMFRINRIAPFKLPSILGWLGPLRCEFFLGQLTGYQFVLTPSGLTGQFGQALAQQPFLHGQKISFKPTRNFEFGIFRTTVYGGPGYPLNFHDLLRSLFSTQNEAVGLTGSAIKPGDRRSGLDFSYRIPRLRNWVTFYGDGFTEDQISPIGYFDRSAWHAGLYFSRIPKFQKLDLRVEGVYTDNPLGGGVGLGFFYRNLTWKDGYRNNGNLIGSWIGREGQGAQAWSNYWFSSRNRLQLNFRHQKVSQEFIPRGGTLTDAGVRSDYWIRSGLGITASVQYEKWLFPVIDQKEQNNVAVSIGIQFQPRKTFRPSFHRTTENLSSAGDKD